MKVRVLPERGLDVAEAFVAGRQIAWLSGLGDVQWNGDWWASWGGGLVTTCGLDNVGRASEGVGLHGTYSSLAARDVVREDDGVRAAIDDPRGLAVRRRIEFRDDGLRLSDRTTNVGSAALEAPLLYHVNLGDWVERVETDATAVAPRDEDAAPHDPTSFPARADEPERVWEHVGATCGPRGRVRDRGHRPLEPAPALAVDRAEPRRARARARELLRPRPRARPGGGTAARARAGRDARDLALDHGKGDEMKLGLLTAAFPDLSLDEVARWAAANGFEALEVACWPSGGGERRRYAGVTHVDVDAFDPDEVRATLDRHGLAISALAYYPNNLHPDDAHREAGQRPPAQGDRRGRPRSASTPSGRSSATTRTARCPRTSSASGRSGRRSCTTPASAACRIAIENCPMIFSLDEWPGGNNLAWAPAIWDAMFEAIPDANFGLNLDPSHLVWLMIDYERAVYDYADRIFHVHAKDLEVRREGLYRHGSFSGGLGWQVPRLPGLGEVNWPRFVAALYAVGYDHVLSVEHEDRRFEGDEELVKRGFLIARETLRPLVA